MALDMSSLDAIDARILTLEKEPAHLKKHRNSLAPFCKLPPELIIRIVRLVQNDSGYVYRSPEQYHLYEAMTYNCKWTRIMLLCRYIRAVVLDARSPWKVVDSRSKPEWIDLCLQRCGNAPLDNMVCCAGDPTQLEVKRDCLLPSKVRVSIVE
jgi:hypothetical protein